MRFERGSLVLGSIQGAPIRLHWSLLVVPFLLGRFQWMPITWATWTALVLAHELGHLGMVRRFGFAVLEVEVHGMGGHCRWQGRASPLQRAWIASGGILAQLGVLVLAVLASWLLPWQTMPVLWEIRDVLIWQNLWMMAFNLLPIPPLDGVEALKLPGLLRARRERAQAQQAQTTAAQARQQAAQDLQAQDAQEVPPEIAAQVDQLLEEVGIRKPPAGS